LLRDYYDLSLKVAKDAAELLEKGQAVDIDWLKMKASQQPHEMWATLSLKV
jgi:hypothetical protein